MDFVEILTAVSAPLISIIVGVIVGVYVRIKTLQGMENTKCSMDKVQQKMLEMAKTHAEELRDLKRELARLRAEKREGK